MGLAAAVIWVVVLSNIVGCSAEVPTIDVVQQLDLKDDRQPLSGAVRRHLDGMPRDLMEEDSMDSSSMENITVTGLVVNVSQTEQSWALSGLGPQIVGGEKGAFMFDAAPVAQRGELHLFDQSWNSTQINSTRFGRELGQSVDLTNSTDAPVVDESNNGLFDLIPLFQGVQADRNRQRAILGRCILNVNEIVTAKVCTPGFGNKTSCTKWAMNQMSDAMIQLWKNAQSMFCKYKSDCEASICYKYPGPVGPEGMPAAPSESFTNQPIWIEHDQTAVNNQSVPGNLTMVQQHLNFNAELEKMTFCELLSPPKATTSSLGSGYMATRSCFTARRCKMTKLQKGFCVDGTSSNEPPTDIPCPVDNEYALKLKRQEVGLTTILCSQA